MSTRNPRARSCNPIIDVKVSSASITSAVRPAKFAALSPGPCPSQKAPMPVLRLARASVTRG
ncbi:Uncharacterised protein [Mycobacteroides abscessus]|nr:Uncharacterised protein [Mycobacteroides abscessus]SKU08373.1 Uncharacterised protein [Mycobacteroides abscessus subsp. abscessus]